MLCLQSCLFEQFLAASCTVKWGKCQKKKERSVQCCHFCWVEWCETFNFAYYKHSHNLFEILKSTLNIALLFSKWWMFQRIFRYWDDIATATYFVYIWAKCLHSRVIELALTSLSHFLFFFFFKNESVKLIYEHIETNLPTIHLIEWLLNQGVSSMMPMRHKVEDVCGSEKNIISTETVAEANMVLICFFFL